MNTASPAVGKLATAKIVVGFRYVIGPVALTDVALFVNPQWYYPAVVGALSLAINGRELVVYLFKALTAHCRLQSCRGLPQVFSSIHDSGQFGLQHPSPLL